MFHEGMEQQDELIELVSEPAEAEEKTASGIIIPDTAKEKRQKGTVVAAGNGKKMNH